TVTDKTAGSAGNTIPTTSAVSGFAWGGGTLAGGTDGQPSIVALNNLYCGASVAASATGTFTATFSSTDFTGGEFVAIVKSPTTLPLTASPPTKATQAGTFSGVA